jgi:hypothetical protein
MNCLNCDTVLKEVYPGSAKKYAFRDALHIQVHLGYGEFMDQDQFQVGSPQGCFCNSCAKKVISQFLGFQRLVDV